MKLSDQVDIVVRTFEAAKGALAFMKEEIAQLNRKSTPPIVMSRLAVAGLVLQSAASFFEKTKHETTPDANGIVGKELASAILQLAAVEFAIVSAKPGSEQVPS